MRCYRNHCKGYCDRKVLNSTQKSYFNPIRTHLLHQTFVVNECETIRDIGLFHTLRPSRVHRQGNALSVEALGTWRLVHYTQTTVGPLAIFSLRMFLHPLYVECYRRFSSHAASKRVSCTATLSCVAVLDTFAKGYALGWCVVDKHSLRLFVAT